MTKPTTSRRALGRGLRFIALAAGTTALSLTAGGAAGAAPARPLPAALRVPAPSPDAATITVQQAALRVVALIRQQSIEFVDERESEIRTLRDRLAVGAATQLGVSSTAMRAAFARTNRQHLLALAVAITQIGVPYHGYMSKPGVGFDCSGLVMYAWNQAGVTLPRSSGSQIRSVPAVTLGAARAGDLVYYPGHVMLSLGVGEYVIHAPYTGTKVRFDTAGHHSTLRAGDPALLSID